MSERLTEEQQAMVQDHLRLVKYFCKKYKKPLGMDDGDWYGECLLQLVQAVLAYDPKKGQLPALLNRMVFIRRSNINRYFRRGTRGRVFQAGVTSEAGDDFDFFSIQGREHPWAEIEASQLIADVMKYVSDRERKALELIAQGFTQREIANFFGVTDQRVSEIVTTARVKIAMQFPSLAVCSKTCSKCNQPAQDFGKGRGLYCSVCNHKIRMARRLNQYHKTQREKRAASA